MKKHKNQYGFTIFELLFIIVVVAFATVGIMQMTLQNSKAKTSIIERSKSGEYANSIMEQYVAQEQNSPSTFWSGFSSNPSPITLTDVNGNYSSVYKTTKICSNVCGILRVVVTMAQGGGIYTIERTFSITPTITLTPTPTNTPTPTPTPTP